MNQWSSERAVRHPNNALEEWSLQDGDLQIAVVVFPGFSSLDVALINQIFHYANQPNGRRERRYFVRLLSISGGLVTGMSNIRVWSDMTASTPTDITFVSGGDGARAAVHDVRLLDWIRETNRRSPLLIGVAEGRALISAAGISCPDAPAVTSHMNADMTVPPRDIYDPSGALLSALSIVKQELGIQAAQEVGERVIPDSSRRLSAILGEPSDDIRRDKIREAAEWIEQNCSRPITVADISQCALMSERTLLRHFKAVMGVTPSDYLLKARFELACRLLVSTALPIDKIARRCSFSSGMALAKLFRKRLSVSASEYRAVANGYGGGGVRKIG
ncbi:MAG: helix-turn-helix domain-containing protein [Paraburkholderia sp.]|nr:MAG: helix-turn-helix domain-containing protein [Paraburkholderia sp.]